MDNKDTKAVADCSAREKTDEGRGADSGLTTVRAELAIPVSGNLDVARAMQMINGRFAQQPLNADEIYLLPPAEMSNQNLDSFHTRMAESSLRRYQQDGKAGVPLMNSHRRLMPAAELPLGQSYEAELEEDGGGLRLVEMFYMLRGLELNGHKTDHLIRGIEGGIIRDVSIGFSGGWYRCGLCGKELAPRSLFLQETGPEFCEHVPGMRYDGQLAYAWVEDAYQVEGSLVYSGSTPGAVLRKAQWAAQTGRLSRGEVGALEDQWGIRIWSGSRTYSSSPEREVRTEMDKEEIVALVQEKAPELMERIGQAEEPVAALLDAWADARAIKADADGLREKAINELQERLAQAETELGQVRNRIAELEPRAQDGDAYREDLIEQTVAERVRAQGDTFDADAYRTVLAVQPLDYVRSELVSWQKMAEKVFQPGRPAGEIIGRPQDKQGKKDSKTPGKPARAYKA